MNCKFCAGEMAIEDEKCPHCGQENPYYEAHRIDMENFERKFKNTEAMVVEKTNKYTRKTLIITTISVLFALILLCIFVLNDIDEITYTMARNSNLKNADEIAKVLSTYEESGEYILFADYYDSKPVKYGRNALEEYYSVYDMCSRYRNIVEKVMDLTSVKFSESNLSTYASGINSALEGMYSVRYKEIENEVLSKRFTDEHVATMDDILDRTYHLLIAYCGLKESDIEGLKDLTSSKRTSIIEDRLVEVLGNEE